jgi:hypothetical protein
VKRASLAEVRAPEFRHSTGHTHFPFRIDGFKHIVHAIYHEPPELPPVLWQICVEELALACLVDLSTASMARKARAFFEPGQRGRKMFQAASEALRLEVLADHRLPVGLLPVAFDGSGRASSYGPSRRADPDRVLLLMGGGKDSLYTYHLLRQAGYDVRCFYLTEARRTWQQLRRVYRTLEGKSIQYRAYLDVNRRGPVDEKYGTTYLSQFQIGQAIAASLPYALESRCQYVALGLERSSDAPMICYRGRAVNHQHQKSSAFIRLLNRHLDWRLRGAVQVVSPLHGLYDMGIYARFLKAAPGLVALQSSCGGSNGRSPHCGRCEKCAFVAALFAGLGGNLTLYRRLFPRDPLQDPRLFTAWLSPDGTRPMTCAGFGDEVRLSLALLRNRGWSSKVLSDQAGSKLKREKLAWFLGNHPNGLIPSAMRKRIMPHLHLEITKWLEALPGPSKSLF